MSETSEGISKPSSKAKSPKKDGRGGRRPGAGRPKGALGAATIKRERKIQREVLAKLAEMPPEEVDAMGPWEALEFTLKSYIRAGNLSGVAAVALGMLPYSRARVASMEGDRLLPPDLAPDPVPVPDEPGPANPIL